MDFESHSTSLGPSDLSLELLKEITNGFSEDKILGSGGFGVVYKGVFKNGQEIAVKKLHDIQGLNDKQFYNELQNLMRFKHQNIVQLVGYCYEVRHRFTRYNGEVVLGKIIDRVICLEYLHNGSLEKHLSDETHGLDWHTHFKIIKGICEGLKYLHEGGENHIYHLDLKPSNILLDKNMVPKIADFGLSRISDGTQILTKNIIGTPGYMPVEYIDHGNISEKVDIFSLGVIIIEIMTGPKGRFKSSDMPSEEFIKHVHGNWRNRLQATCSNSVLEVCCEQVRRCIGIALSCVVIDWHKRPSIGDIIHMLKETETVIQKPLPKLLDANPAHLCFPFRPNSLISCSLQLTNKTNDNVAFRLWPQSPELYIESEFHSIVPPRSTYTLTVTMKQHRQPPSKEEEFFILESSIVGVDDFNNISPDIIGFDYENFFQKVKETSKVGQEVKLMVAIDQLEKSYQQVLSIDVHPWEPWILTGHHRGHVCIWNYRTKSTIDSSEVTKKPVCTVKFIARKQWFVAGDRAGFIYVYNHNPMHKLRSFEAGGSHITSLAVHATEPYVLSASNDHLIKLWDWQKDWNCIQTFEGHRDIVWQVTFDPNDSNTFASVSDDRHAKIWSLYSTTPKSNFEYSDDLLSVDYLTFGDRQYLITGSFEGNAYVWDLQTDKCFETLKGHECPVSAVCSHDELPILFTGSGDGTVRQWNSATFRPMVLLSCDLRNICALRCFKGSMRVVIGHEDGLSLIEIEHEQQAGSMCCAGDFSTVNELVENF